MSDTGDDSDLWAAEYVIGFLDGEQRREFEAARARDPSLDAAALAWERRLMPLATLVPPVPPPAALWQRIEHALGPPPPGALARLWGSVALWRATTALAAVAAVVLAFVVAQPSRPPPSYVAGLAPLNGPGVAFVAEVRPDGTVFIRPVGPVSVAADRDLELWSLPPGAARPVAVGVLPAAGLRAAIAAASRSGTQLLVSLEPKGGSPTGQPTGPVLYGGKLTRVE